MGQINKLIDSRIQLNKSKQEEREKEITEFLNFFPKVKDMKSYGVESSEKYVMNLAERAAKEMLLRERTLETVEEKIVDINKELESRINKMVVEIM
jgi:hypothetical protein